MAAKPETTFLQGVNKLLSRDIYHMKNNNPYVGGIPDVWYSGFCGDLWVEYKYLSTVPVWADIDPMKLLSALQADWLRKRYIEGRHVAVIIGCPKGGVVLENLTWENAIPAKQFVAALRSKKDLAAFITDQVA